MLFVFILYKIHKDGGIVEGLFLELDCSYICTPPIIFRDYVATILSHLWCLFEH